MVAPVARSLLCVVLVLAAMVRRVCPVLVTGVRVRLMVRLVVVSERLRLVATCGILLLVPCRVLVALETRTESLSACIAQPVGPVEGPCRSLVHLRCSALSRVCAVLMARRVVVTLVLCLVPIPLWTCPELLRC